MSERDDVRTGDGEPAAEDEQTTAAEEDVATEDGGDDERLTTADLAGRRDDADTDAGSEDADVDVARDSGAGDSAAEERQPLFAGEDVEKLRGRWSDIQTGFVDEPRRAVEDADALVAEVMQQLAETFATERATLEQQWDGDGEPSTEDLRVGLQRYRSFFDRLLSA